MQTIKKALPPFLVILALVTAFWAPVLFDGKTLIHGDSVLHSLALWDFQARNAHNFDSLLWSSGVYGGHPLYAEGQGGFIYPVNLLLARIISPLFANGFAHWLEMLIGGIGLIGLSRTLGNSYWASGFAALATLFAGYWMQVQQNMTVGAASTIVPWVLWAGEHWIQRFDWRSAVLFGIATALAVLAGYPHYVHGAILYIAASLLSNLFWRESRGKTLKQFPMIWKTGAVAILVCIGLAAAQLFPLLELVGYSHRSGGTAVGFFDVPLSIYTRGLLYNLHTIGYERPDFIPILGSPLVCLLFSIFVFFKAPERMKGHIIATLFLFNLAVAGTSPLFKVIYNYHLIPGLHYFRLMAPYFIVALVGVGVVAAHSIDNLALSLESAKTSGWRGWLKPSWHKGIATLIFVAFWLLLLRNTGIDVPVGSKHAAIVVCAVVATILLTLINQTAKIPAALFLILAAETAAMKTHEYRFGDTSLLDKPTSVRVMEADDPKRNFKYYDISHAFLYALGSPLATNLDQGVKSMQAHLCGLTGIRWNIRSMMGALALPLRERMMIDPLLMDEINAKTSTPAGLRLIDLLGIKYIGFDTPPPNTPAFRLRDHEPATNTWLMENTAARPRFQTFTNYTFVSSPEEALTTLQSVSKPTLALERPKFIYKPGVEQNIAPSNDEAPRIEFNVVKESSTYYRLKVNAEAPGWLFLADANYPGWRAYIDDDEVPVFTGQILGKAVYVPSGTHKVRLVFNSQSFEIGRGITLLTLTAILVVAVTQRKRKKGAAA